MSSVPVVFSASPADLRAAVGSVRERIAGLAESRLYQFAVILTVLSRVGGATLWTSWDSAPPTQAMRFGRAEITSAMRQLFETTPNALLHNTSEARKVLGQPSRIMLEVLYDPGGPLTLVADVPVAGGRRDAVKLAIDDEGWVWSGSRGPGHPVTLVEYNPVNTLNQQNGVACALPAHGAVKANPADPASVYAVRRNQCPHRNQMTVGDPICTLNGKVCGGSGEGAREATKPRLLVPPVAGSDAFMLTPDTLMTLVAQAKSNGAPLPKAGDLSLVVSWCSGNGVGAMDNMRLLQLLGAPGIELLTDPE